MIVKARCGNGWKMYEASEVQWRPYSPAGYSGTFEVEFIEPDPQKLTVDGGSMYPKKEITLDNKKIVVSDEEVYILNDNGKTVERV